MNKKFDYDNWNYEYHNKKIINVKNELASENLDIIAKLGIIIKDGMYTEYEYECLKLDISAYYIEDDMDEEELEYAKSLDETGVSRTEYNNLLKVFEQIDEKYQNKFCKIWV